MDFNSKLSKRVLNCYVLLENVDDEINNHQEHNSRMCWICDKIFSNKNDIKRHIDSVHKGLKNNKCGECDLAFSDKSSLKKHIEA